MSADSGSDHRAPVAHRSVAAAGAVLAAVGLAACGSGDPRPGNDEYAGRAQTANPTHSATATGDGATVTAAASPTGGPYADGTYTVSQSYGVLDDVIEEDSIDVALTLESGYITEVTITGHPFASRSREYIDDFSQEISGAVVGHSVEDAHVTALAGASKTSAAYNEAVDAIATQARSAAATATAQ